MQPKKLSLEKMAGMEGGWCVRTSHLVCGGLGILYGFINPFLGAGVSLACDASWYDFESDNPPIIGNSC
ncbi:MAG: hypothetical protein ACLFQA_02320 [Bacteroidales bacterium]